ncbi:hypothetical protein SEPCBS57363_003008 [Sporothrix epigloea]|uniref:2-dehydropantoate 2-reductase n=1 Tax=Sporothrix epigloea TaxID=1892477 RepID=A0ABP0DJ23_9PEZI
MRNENLESGRETGRPVSSDDGILHLRPSQMVYVLGGNLQATYLAHILSCVPKSPKVRLLLFSKQFAENWRREGSQVQILRPGQKVQPMRLRGEIVKPPPDPVRALAARARRGSYQSSSIQEPRRQTIIQNLIVTEACVPSIAAIARIKHRLDNNSTICLVQPGLGVVERLNELHFPYPETRPRYILAHMTHSLGYTSRPFSVAELGIGKVMLTLYTPPNEQPAAPARVSSNGEVSSDNVTTFLKQLSTPSGDTGGNPEVAMPEGELLQVKAAMIDNGLHLMYLLGVAPTLGTGFYRYGAFLQRKLPEMISQSASETIATVLDLPLGDEIMHNGEARALLQGLITEMIDVVRALPETHADPKLLEFVTSGQLERQVKQLLHQYDGNSKRTANLRRLGESSVSGSSTGDVTDALGQRPLGPIVSPGPCKMAIRTALGRRADVQFLNGYFVRRGREVGIACPMNEMAVRMVQARRLANQTKRAEHINIEGLASEDVREAAALSRAQSAQRRADAEKGIERAPEPIHSSPAGKFPWRRSTQDEEVDGSEFDADTTEDEGAVEAAALRDKPTPAGQSSVLA